MKRGSPDGSHWGRIAQLYAARIVGLLVGAGLSIVAARLLGPENQGNFATLKSAVLLGAQLTNVGLSSALIILFSRRRVRVGRYRHALYLWPIAVAVVLTALTVVLASQGWARPSATFWFLASAWLPLQLLLVNQSSTLVALQETRMLGLLEAGGRFVALGLGTAALVLFPSRVDLFALALVCADLVIVAAGAWYLRSVAPSPPRARPGTRKFMAAAFRLGLRAYPVLLIPFLLIRSDILLVAVLRGVREAGIYSIAAQLIDLGLVLPATAAALVLPSLTRTADAAGVIRESFRPLLLILVGLSVAMAAGGAVGIRLLFGERYAEAYPALLLLLPGFVCLGLEGLLAQYFAAGGFPPFLAFSWLAAFALNVILNVAFVPRFGFLAAAASSSVGYALIFGAVLLRFRRDTSVNLGDLLRPKGTLPG